MAAGVAERRILAGWAALERRAGSVKDRAAVAATPEYPDSAPPWRMLAPHPKESSCWHHDQSTPSAARFAISLVDPRGPVLLHERNDLLSTCACDRDLITDLRSRLALCVRLWIRSRSGRIHRTAGQRTRLWRSHVAAIGWAHLELNRGRSARRPAHRFAP
jgi:hypothetical protein